MGNLLLLDDTLAFCSLTISYYQYQEPSTSGTPTSGTGMSSVDIFYGLEAEVIGSIRFSVSNGGEGWLSKCISASVHQCIKWSLSVVIGIEHIDHIEQCNAIFRSSTVALVALYLMLQYYYACWYHARPSHTCILCPTVLYYAMPCSADCSPAASCQAKPSRVYHA